MIANLPLILIDLDVKATKLNLERLDKLLKETAFSEKKIIIPNEKAIYKNILLKIEDLSENQQEKFLLEKQNIEKQILRIAGKTINSELSKAIFLLFESDLDLLKSCSITFIRELDYPDINIFYSDGSSKADKSAASYACVELLEEDISGDYDYFSGKTFRSNEYSGRIENGTNNIGELNGIKFISEHFGEKSIQLVISDSEYSIKAFREWIHTWEKNNYRTYSKKPIQNGELIRETRENLKNSNKIVLLKWTKGHANDTFNEKCDELAKKELGL